MRDDSSRFVGVEEENFRTIMKYIIGLIEKDKLLESLVEKLCLRFRATRTERQWRDISFCLSLFPYRSGTFSYIFLILYIHTQLSNSALIQ